MAIYVFLLIHVESRLLYMPISFQNSVDKTSHMKFLSCWHFASMLQMGCNLIFTQLCCAHTQLPHTRGINLSLKTWPGVKSGTSGRNEAAGAAQKHGPSACLPATRHNFDRFFICQEGDCV